MNLGKNKISTDVDEPGNQLVFFGMAMVIVSLLMGYFLLIKDSFSIEMNTSVLNLWIACIAFLIVGIFLIYTSSIWELYCYKIEVGDKFVYISKAEFFITKRIDVVIEIPIEDVTKVTKKWSLKLVSEYRDQKMYFLELKHPTKFGSKIPFIIADNETKESIETKLKKLV